MTSDFLLKRLLFCYFISTMHLPNSFQSYLDQPNKFLGLFGIPLGLVAAVLAIVNPLYFAAGFVAIVVTVCFFVRFEPTLIALLVIRSGLDLFSDQGLPAVFALGLDALILSYVMVLYLTKQKIFFDKFFLIFAVWVIAQGLWPVLTAVDGLGLSNAYLGESVREWIRLFSWLMVYLAVCQLQGRLRPEQIVNGLFLALIAPILVATLQLTLPPHILPSFLQATTGAVFETGSRINGTLGHPNTFSSFLIMFIGLTYWKIEQGKGRLAWCFLLVLEIFFLVATKALVGLPMLVVLLLTLVVPRLKFKNAIGVTLLFIILILLFYSTDFGRERLASVLETPILNSDISVDRAILLSWSDGNSFNWRIAQWNFLLSEWTQSPILGYGLGLATYLGPIRAYAHNDYVRVLVEGGIIGLFLSLVFYTLQLAFLSITYFLETSASHKQFCLVLIGIFISYMVGMITENIWSHTTTFYYWWTLLCISLWDWPNSNSLKVV